MSNCLKKKIFLNFHENVQICLHVVKKMIREFKKLQTSQYAFNFFEGI